MIRSTKITLHELILTKHYFKKETYVKYRNKYCAKGNNSAQIDENAESMQKSLFLPFYYLSSKKKIIGSIFLDLPLLGNN